MESQALSAAPVRRRRLRLGRPAFAALAIPTLVAGGLFAVDTTKAEAEDAVTTLVSKFKATDGRIFTATNHLVNQTPLEKVAEAKFVQSALDGSNPSAKEVVSSGGELRKKYIVAWAGDYNAGDRHSAQLNQLRLPTNPVTLPDQIRDDAIGPDFIAVIDATKGSPEYGKVVNTVTVGPVVENEPHHMQYLYHKGDSIFAGGLFSDITYVFDVKSLPEVKVTGVNLPTDTPCGSVPDAYWTLKDGTAYGTYMGGADLAGPCRYTNGEVRFSNGFGGSPGSIVRIDKQGKTLSEIPAALAESEDPARCVNLPAIPTGATCANPHGIQAREDLNLLIASDYAEPRNLTTDPLRPLDARVFRDTVRIWDISDRDNAKLKSVSVMPDGPRTERNPSHEEPRGIMEVTVTNQKKHKGAFASSMCGGVVYYTPDITVGAPKWREVFDVSTATRFNNPQATEGGGCTGAGWVQTSANDKYLYHAVIGRGPGSTDPTDNGAAKQVYMLNIEKLLAAGTGYKCNIDTLQEVNFGGKEKDCPTLSDSYQVQDNTSGGPHWGTPDNFVLGKDGLYRETLDEKRIAFSNYFVARLNTDGNHKLCILDISKNGKFALDESFVDENNGTSCVDFNRTSWPHGDFGDAKPHSMLFVVADKDLK